MALNAQPFSSSFLRRLWHGGTLDPTVRLDTMVKRSARDGRCYNISRRHLGISWFLGVLFVSTCIVRPIQSSQILKNGTIVIKLLS